MSNTIVHLVEERRRYWRTLQYLAGRHVEKLDAEHHVELEALQHRYEESRREQESSLDTIARAMSELAAASSAPPASLAGGAGAVRRRRGPGGGGAGGAAAAAATARRAGAAVHPRRGRREVRQLQDLLPAGAVSCSRRPTIVVDGIAKEVGAHDPGRARRIKVTPELMARVARVAANCDSEIIR